MGNLLPKPPSIPPATGKKWPGWVPDPEEVKARLEAAETHLSDYKPHVPFGGTSTNSGNDYSISTPAIDSLAEGMAVCFKCNADSTGAATLNWNGKGAKSIKKANGTDVTNLKSGGIYTLRYDGANFILQGEGASGNATASDLLSGKTATVDAGEITGTMPNRGAVNITPGTSAQSIIEGYHNGSGYVVGDANLVAENIKNGVSIFGVIGSLEGKRFATGTEWTDGSKTPQFVTIGWRPKIVAMTYVFSGEEDSHSARWESAYSGTEVSGSFGPNPPVIGSFTATGFSWLGVSIASRQYVWWAYEK